MARVLIAGCGFVGTALGCRLVAEGHQVFALRRACAGLPGELEGVAADLVAAETLRGLPRDLDFVFYTASAGARNESAYRAAYVTGVENLLAALRQQGHAVRRFFFTSSTAVYGQSHGEWVDESSPTEPTHFSGRILLEGEQHVARGGFAGTVVRFGGIYGPGRVGLVGRLRRGEVRLTPGALRYTNRIHRDDCAGVLAHLMALDAPHELYLGVDCEPAEERVVVTWLAERLGVAVPVGAPATDPEGRRGANKRCRNQRLLSSGYAFLYPTFRDGYGAMLEAAHR